MDGYFGRHKTLAHIANVTSNSGGWQWTRDSYSFAPPLAGVCEINAKMSPKEIREMISLSPESDQFMRQVSAKLNISGRVFDRILRVGRTIADLAQCPEVQKNHLAEAVQYRDVSIS
jgi:predicted ATPase with chaperone activity